MTDIEGRSMGADGQELYEDEDPDIDVVVECPFCSVEFSGSREGVEEELFQHIWGLHEDSSIDFMLHNMYVPERIKAAIFEELGPDYISWIVDTSGEILEKEEPLTPRTLKKLR
ncbi:MAG: hypothetical protein QCI82_01790 [Candidatus Thermoplasmatota archaeon]|nr:hypothetical protein [Candidatus Thermoplasmatota archaeon]